MKKIILLAIAATLSGFSAQADWGSFFDRDWDNNSRLYRYYNCPDSYRGVPSFRGQHRRKKGLCKRAYNQPEQIEACRVARRAAMAGAAFRVRPKAIHDGLVDGFDCGIEAGVNAGNSDYNYRRAYNNLSPSLENEVVNDTNGSIESRVKGPAINSGEQMAANEVLSRFRRAVTSSGGDLPSDNPGRPNPGYNGISNGFNINGYAVQSTDEILDDIYADDYLEIPWIASTYNEYGWSPENRRYKYGKKRRRRGKHGYGSFNSPYDRIWMKIARSRNKPQRLKRIVRTWRKLSDQPIIIEKQVEFQPPADENGVLPPKEIRIEKTELPSQKAVFSRIFKRLWDHSVHRAYYRIFENHLDEGFQMGVPAGEKAGQIYAEQRGTRSAYNELYQEVSIDMFGNFFQPAYQSEFADQYDHFESNSIIENMNWQMVGSVSDGALLEGEAASFNFSLTNIGGVAKSFGVSANENTVGEGSGAGGASSQDYSVDGLQKKAFATESFFILPDDAISMSERKTNISVSLSAGGKTRTKSLTIFKPAGFENGQAGSSLQQAELFLPVTIHNPKSISSLEDVKVRMIVNGQVADEKDMGSLAPGEQSLVFKMSQEFFAMLGKTYNFKVELDYAGETIQARENLQVSIDKKQALVEYFDYLVLQKSAKLPSGTSYSSYLEKYLNAVTDVSKAEIQSVADKMKVADSRKERLAVKRAMKPMFKLDRRDRLESGNASILLQIYKKRPYNDSSRGLRKKLESNVKGALAKLASKNLSAILQTDLGMGSRGDDRHKRDYFRNTICGGAQVLFAFSQNKTRKQAERVDIKAKMGGKKIKFTCDVD